MEKLDVASFRNALNSLKEVIEKCNENNDAIIADSRAKNRARKYSDVDIAILSEELTSGF